LRFIADDLGAITPEVVALLDQLQIPGTRVLQFEFGSDLETNSAPSEHRRVNSVVYTGTHDNDTTAGWYRKLPGTQQKALQKRLGTDGRGIVRAMIREALASQADTAIIPAQDLLELESEARMNIPGTSKGNWQWRLKDGALRQELAQWLRSMTLTCARLGRGEPCAISGRYENNATSLIAKATQ
jgi:4-alpha-glucanotransferase